jgi:alkylation response protein AidB-like acyl-CoA dehydrogenase
VSTDSSGGTARHVSLCAELTPEEHELQSAAIEFARAELGSDIASRDRGQIFNRDDWLKCARFGVLGMPIEKVNGGLGLGAVSLIAVMEGLGYGSCDSGLLFSLNAHLWTNSIPIQTYGTEAQRRKYLPGLCDGRLIGANGASEPDAGSDVFSLRTTARRDGDEYELNGTKCFVSNAPIADLFVAYATIDRTLGPMGVTAFIIERDTPGLRVGGHVSKMGLRTSPMAEISFEDCRIPVENRLGREGRGVEVFECSMEWERGCILGCFLGVMRRQLESCIKHAKSRKQFGTSISRFQSVANRIVDMRVRLDASRPLVYRIGQLKDKNQSALLESSIAKLYVSEALVQSMLEAVQVFGGYGYMTEQGVERDLRDAIGSTLYSGTSDIQRNIIAKCLGL